MQALIKKHLELYAKMGAEPQSRNLGKPLLYMTTETATPTSMSTSGRMRTPVTEKRNVRTLGDPDWLAYVAESGKLGALETQDNRLMMPVDFFPTPVVQE